MLNSRDYIKIVSLHIVVSITFFLGLYLLGIIEELPSNNNILQWDSGWYFEIISKGYEFKPNEQSNTGFFPLFPFLWKITYGNAIFISILNYLFFIIGIYFLLKSFNKKIDKKVILISLSFPSLFFMYVPYSESLFFCIASLFIYSNYSNNRKLKLISLFLASLTRPTIFFFLPALFFTEILTQENIKKMVKNLMVYTSVILIGTGLAFYIIGFNDNYFFAYSDSQINNWNHPFSLPKFPLTTWRGYRILWLDILGIWIIISSILYALNYFTQFVNRKKIEKKKKNILLSLGYLSMIFFYILFFHPKEVTTGLTSVLSVNRYVFCTPFFFYLFYSFYTKNDIKKDINILVISAVIAVLLIGFPFYPTVGLDRIKSVIFGVVILIFFLFQVSPKLFKTKYLFYAVYIINTLLQVYLFQSFLKGNWIG